MRADRRTALGCWHAALAAEGALVAKGVCGVSGQEPGRQRAWAAEATATLAAESIGGRGDCGVGAQGITRGRPAVLWRCFSGFRQFLSKCRRFRRQYLSGCSAPDGQQYRKRYQGFFQNKRGGFNNAFALTAFSRPISFRVTAGRGTEAAAPLPPNVAPRLTLPPVMLSALMMTFCRLRKWLISRSRLRKRRALRCRPVWHRFGQRRVWLLLRRFC